MDKIYKRLGEAKTDKERVRIYEELAQFQQRQIEELANENQRLKELLEHKEETESIMSSGSSLSSDTVSKRKDYLSKQVSKKQQTSKQSTAPERREMKYLDTIQELREEVKQKDLKIKGLEEKQTKTNLGRVKKLLDITNKRLDGLEQTNKKLLNQVGITPK